MFIVGGGRSAHRFNWELCWHHRILAVNDALAACMDASPVVASFSLDNRWIRNNRELWRQSAVEKFAAIPLETWPDLADMPGVTYLRHSTEKGLSDDPGVIFGCNSGHGALNLAYLKGARTIYLVGFDMDPRENHEYRFWIDDFRRTVPQLEAKGIMIWNLNPESHIDAFPKLTLGEALGVARPTGHPGPENQASGAPGAQKRQFRGNWQPAVGGSHVVV